MNRRAFLCGLTVGTLATPLAEAAQQTARAYRVGCLSSRPIPVHGRTDLMEAFEQGLREMNFTPGLNLAIELRSPAPGFRTMVRSSIPVRRQSGTPRFEQSCARRDDGLYMCGVLEVPCNGLRCSLSDSQISKQSA
jgi:hypothetical protein